MVRHHSWSALSKLLIKHLQAFHKQHQKVVQKTANRLILKTKKRSKLLRNLIPQLSLYE